MSASTRTQALSNARHCGQKMRQYVLLNAAAKRLAGAVAKKSRWFQNQMTSMALKKLCTRLK